MLITRSHATISIYLQSDEVKRPSQMDEASSCRRPRLVQQGVTGYPF